MLTISSGSATVSVGRIAQFEMRSAALFDADVENRLAVIATHRFQMRLDHARDLVQPGLGVALGRGHPVPFLDPQSFADLGFGDFAETVKIENVDPQILRKGSGDGQKEKDGKRTAKVHLW